MTVALLPATFDPITYGHLDIIRRASRLFDRLVVAVHARSKKKVLFSVDDRVAMVRESVAELPNVEVVQYEGLTVHLAAQVGATVMVKGLRAVSDFESEFQQATLNRRMLPGLEVVCMFASVDYGAVSSSLIKEIAENGGDVSDLVPPAVARRLRERFESRTELVSGR